MPSRSEPKILFLCTANYYRSRFAELVFNHAASARGIPHRAESAGLEHDCASRNPGPISPHTIAGLRARDIDLPEPVRAPRSVTAADLTGAALVIALKELEHRPLLAARFSAWVERVQFWHVDDVEDSAPEHALALIEGNVHELIERLGRGG